MADPMLAAVNDLIDAVNAQTVQISEIRGKLDALSMDIEAAIEVCERIAVVQTRGLTGGLGLRLDLKPPPLKVNGGDP